MDELNEIQKDLKTFAVLANRIKYLVRDKFDYAIDTDFEELLDNIKYLRGYIGCIKKYNIKLS